MMHDGTVKHTNIPFVVDYWFTVCYTSTLVHGPAQAGVCWRMPEHAGISWHNVWQDLIKDVWWAQALSPLFLLKNNLVDQNEGQPTHWPLPPRKTVSGFFLKIRLLVPSKRHYFTCAAAGCIVTRAGEISWTESSLVISWST
jgi:hypothetical protein